MSKPGIVYVFRISGTDIYKVGRTCGSAEARKGQIQVVEGVELEFVDAVRVADACATERAMHTELEMKFERCRHHGREWFTLRDDALREFLATLQAAGERVDAEFDCGGLCHSEVFMIRITGDMRAELDAFHEEMRAAHPEINISWADAARSIVRMGLDAAAVKRGKKP